METKDLKEKLLDVDNEEGHSHKHSHNHQHQKNLDVAKGVMKQLMCVSILCISFMVVEIVGGYLAGSLAIMSDAAHLLSDFSGFAISYISIYIGTMPATYAMTYGYHRAEIIGSLVSVILIWGLTLWLVYEAILRIITPTDVDGKIMLITSIIGLIVNLIMAKVLHSSPGHSHDHGHGHDHGDDKGHSHGHSHGHDHDHENMNIRAAAIHIIGDIIQSIGVIIAACFIYFFPTWTIIDPMCTFLFSILVLFTTIFIVRDCIKILMEGTPSEINIEKLTEELEDVPGVEEVHDVHVWSLSVGKLAMSAHIESDSPLESL